MPSTSMCARHSVGSGQSCIKGVPVDISNYAFGTGGMDLDPYSPQEADMAGHGVYARYPATGRKAGGAGVAALLSLKR